MPKTPIPTTIGELLDTAAAAIDRISQHREAMAQVALQAKANAPQPQEAGGEQK